MCGIFGLLNKSTYLTPKFINDAFMNGKNRGPETSKYTFINSHTEFGFHRLAINGLNEESNQPMEQNDCILICNGEIYNYDVIYKNEGFTAKTRSDCEIIIHLYKKYGIRKTLEILNGEFAFVLYDKEANKMYVARDPHGVRALYGGYEPRTSDIGNKFGSIMFASELKMLFPFYQVNREIHIEQFYPGTFTTLEYINDSEKSGWQIVTKAEKYYQRKRHWEAGWSISDDIEETILKTINNTLNECVKRRVTTSERQIACLLSGGLDSSLVTALVAKYYGAENLETYSIGMPGSEDAKYAKKVAEHLGTKHTEIVLSENDFFEAIPDVIRTIESYDTTTIRASTGNYLVSKYISENSNAKVIFNGDGSDEVCGGYMYFHKAPNAETFDQECHNLLDNIYTFDVLRSDKSISSNGLEPRTPFLDKEFVDMYLSIPVKYRYHAGNGQCEKYLLRKAFDNDNLLPKEVLWRTKEAFSDGVSSHKKSWFEIINDKITEKYGEHFNKVSIRDNLHNSPKTPEQRFYRDIFEKNYSNMGHLLPFFWMPKYVKATDSSARTLSEYSKEINKTHVELVK